MDRPLPRQRFPRARLVALLAAAALPWAAGSAPAEADKAKVGVVDVALNAGDVPPNLGLQQGRGSVAEHTQQQHLMRRQAAAPHASALESAKRVPARPCSSLLEGEAGKPCSNDGPQPDDPFKEEDDEAIDDIVDGTEPAGDGDPLTEHFWLEYGCRNEIIENLNTVAGGTDQAHFAYGRKKLGKVQCCSNHGADECVRKGAGVCFTGDNNTDLWVTHAEAKTTCEAVGYRLCTRDEVLSSGPFSCCSSGCNVNSQLVWTSTAAVENSVQEHEDLKKTLTDLQKENEKLQSSLDNFGKEVETIKEHVDEKLGIPAGADGGTAANNSYPVDYGSINTAGWPPLPSDQGAAGHLHRFTDEEADAIRAENLRLSHEREQLDVENRKLKNHIIDSIASSVLNNESKVDPSTLPEKPFWPISTPAPNVSNTTNHTFFNESKVYVWSWEGMENSGISHRPVIEELPDGQRIITDHPRDDFMREGDLQSRLHDFTLSAEEVDFSSHEVFANEINLTFTSLDLNKDGKISWGDIENVLHSMKRQGTLPLSFDSKPMEMDFRSSGMDHYGNLDEPGFERFITGISKSTGKDAHEFLTNFFAAADAALVTVVKPCDNCTYVEKHPCDNCKVRPIHDEKTFWSQVNEHKTVGCDNCGEQVKVEARRRRH